VDHAHAAEAELIEDAIRSYVDGMHAPRARRDGPGRGIRLHALDGESENARSRFSRFARFCFGARQNVRGAANERIARCEERSAPALTRGSPCRSSRVMPLRSDEEAVRSATGP